MDTSKMRRPEELPFEIPEVLKGDLDELIAAYETDHPFLDAYINEVEFTSRTLEDAQMDWVRKYYCEWGWLKDGKRTPEFR